MKALAGLVGLILLMVVFVQYTEKRDKAMDESYARLDACIKAQSGMSAAQYYQATGTVPECK